MSTQFLSREDYPELYAAIAKAYPMPTPTNRLRNVTEDEAIDFLNLCKAAYNTAIKESDRAELVSQYRFEMRYWEDYLHANWPEERAKREPFGGKTEPMTKEQMVGAMDYVYDRLRRIPEIEDSSRATDQVVIEIYGSLKTLAAVVDELIRKLE